MNIIQITGRLTSHPLRTGPASGEQYASCSLLDVSYRPGGGEHESRFVLSARGESAEALMLFSRGNEVTVAGQVFIGKRETPYTEVEVIWVQPLVTREPEPEPEPEEIEAFGFNVEVSGPGLTMDQAEKVLDERLAHDEDYGFPYSVLWNDGKKL